MDQLGVKHVDQKWNPILVFYLLPVNWVALGKPLNLSISFWVRHGEITSFQVQQNVHRSTACNKVSFSNIMLNELQSN